MAHLLLIDDDAGLVPTQVREAFPSPTHDVEVAPTGEAGLAAIRRSVPDVVLLDLRLPDASGLDVYQAIRKIEPGLPVIFITGARTAHAAIEAIKLGAFNYLSKPLDLRALQACVDEALEVHTRKSHRHAHRDSGPDLENESGMFGSGAAMLEVYKAIGRVAAQDVTVLITGESGTGKELVARAIVEHSSRARAPFIALNCAAIPEALLESELFGHEKGAFTGAERRRIGKFEQCHGGTLLLDEIGDMPLALQAKILRVLQERTFERVGGNETLHADVRVIAATHRDLRARVADERFRADLYYRLGVFTVQLPPLRERLEDLEALVDHFLVRYNRELGRSVRHVAPSTMEVLRRYSWPGNVRELQSILKQALLNATGNVLLPTFLPPLLPAAAEERPQDRVDLDGFVRTLLAKNGHDVYAETRRFVDTRLIALVLERTNGNQREAARTLGISRQTLRIRMRELGLFVGRMVESIDGTDDRDLTPAD